MGLFESIKIFFGDGSKTVGQINRTVTKTSDKITKPEIVKPKPDYIITSEYKFVISLVKENYPLIFVSGKAGTGKSTLIQYIKDSVNLNLVVLAPTGVAALNIGGVTINSFFMFPPRIILDSDIKKVRDRRLFYNLELLIIDEISMVRADVLDGIDKFLRLNGKSSKLPFGGVKVIFVGDLYQLPPVLKESEKHIFQEFGYATPYFFSAKSLNNSFLIPFELEKVFRQTDSEYINILNDIRLGHNINKILPILNERSKYKLDANENSVVLTARVADADSINDSMLKKIDSKEYLFEGKVTGNITIGEDRLPAPLKLSLKVGAQIMFVKNDSSKRWVNGTIGKIISFESNSIIVELLENSQIGVVDVSVVTWEYYKYEFDSTQNRIIPILIGTYTQIPVMLAWAITIHKSQGKTLGKIKLHLGFGAFASGQLYVALSRTRSLEDVYLDNIIVESDIISDKLITRFYNEISTLKNSIRSHLNNDKPNDLSLPENQCPYCWHTLVLRSGPSGQFMGCSNYPNCKFSKPYSGISNKQSNNLSIMEEDDLPF